MNRLTPPSRFFWGALVLACVVQFGRTAQAQAPEPSPQPPATPDSAPSATATPAPATPPAATAGPSPAPSPAAAAPDAASGAPAPSESKDEKPSEPFAFADFTWLNGTNRQTKAILDTPYFTPEVILDANYSLSTHMPIDNTAVGSTSISRYNELTLAFLGFGGDFHYGNARARMMTQFGVRAVQIPRNDFSTFRGQYDLQNALRYISEMNGGVHLNVLHGINIDAGIFMSYVGLFSYTAFENWMYLPSYTSDMTPWFFNGIRIQIFPTDTFKFEPWIINGWQTYAKFNNMPGFGWQIMWRPKEWLAINSNEYLGWDNQDLPGMYRWHTDTSVVVSYYHNPNSFVSRVASSYTFDVGGEQGDGVAFSGNGTEGNCTTATPCPARFVAGMMYHRVWFGDKFALTGGVGFMQNPSRYLVLTPTGNASPIPQPQSTQGIQYVKATGPFDINLGTDFNAWDYGFGFQYMPIEQFTFDLEWNHREADVPYFAGHGGVTSQDGYITTPTPPGWRPDLVKSEDRLIAAWLVRF